VNRRRVAITGIGPVSPIGVGREAFAAALNAGRHAFEPLSLFATTATQATLAAEIRDFDVQPLLAGRKAYLDRSSQFALGAVALALRDAGFETPPADTGLAMGTAFGSMQTAGVFFEGFLEKGTRFVKPFLFQHTYANTAIGLAAIEFGLPGAHLNFVGALTASASAIAAAYDLVASGLASCMVAGGHEALTEYIYAASDDAGLLCRAATATAAAGPFGKARGGYIPAEGAGMLVLEDWDAALARGAVIQAELTGIGFAADSAIDTDTCTGRGICAAMQAAHDDTAHPEPADTIFASANGAWYADRGEALGILAAVGSQPCPRLVTLKSLLGEALGAGTALQTIGAVLALNGQARQLPGPTDAALDDSLAAAGLSCGSDATATPPRHVAVNAVDPGGNVVSLRLQQTQI
jgi:3-oxoacyl-[acyl-carrier-protein] synthase II